jgi:hypothetical protein
MCRLIEKNGWSLRRINGSHHIYSKPGERKVISIPVHGNRSLSLALRLESRAMQPLASELALGIGPGRLPFPANVLETNYNGLL